MSFNGSEFGYKPCPKCGHTELTAGAFSIVPDCVLECDNCGFSIESEVSWEGCETQEEHDDKCLDHLKDLWNKLDRDDKSDISKSDMFEYAVGHLSDVVPYSDEKYQEKVEDLANAYVKYTDRSIIEKFCETFRSKNKNLIQIFNQGYCYHFACILHNIFNGKIMYNDIDNHFACLYDGKLYDIAGEINYPHNDGYVDWEDYQRSEPLNSSRVINECVYLNINTKDI